MRWSIKPTFENEELVAIQVMETEKGIITFGNLIDIERLDEVGLRHWCGGELTNPTEWQPIPYDVFVSLGGTMNNTIIRLVDKGYIGRKLSWVQEKKLIPDGYCKSCAEEDNLWDKPIIGTDKRLYCNRCLKPFEPVEFKTK